MSSTDLNRVSLSLQDLIDARLPPLKTAASVLPAVGHFPGIRRGVKRGQGIEFTDLRRYVAGDDVRHIDWNVTARSNTPHTRLYIEEREQTTRVAVDMRPCMFTGSESLRAVAAGRFAAALLWRAVELGDRCAVSVISSSGIQHSRPLAGTDGALAGCELIAACFNHAINGNADNTAKLSELLNWFNSARRSTGNCFLLSGFDTPGDGNWCDAIAAAGVSKRFVAILVLDPMEVTALPAGHYHYRHNGRIDTARLYKADHDKLASALQQQLEARRQPMLELGIPLLQIQNTDTATSLVGELQQRALL